MVRFVSVCLILVTQCLSQALSHSSFQSCCLLSLYIILYVVTLFQVRRL